MSFIDIHCHILPGMDDGAPTLKESVKMMEVAEKDGISCIFATPHILDGLYANKGPEIISSVHNLRKHLPRGMELLYGADVRVVPDLIKRLDSEEILTLNGSDYMLIELPEYFVPPHFDSLIFELRHRGIIPIITHPERHLRLMHDLNGLIGLRGLGAICQITAMSITGGFGREIEDAAFVMIDRGLADIIASDAHNADRRPPILSKAYKEVKKHSGHETADRLFFENPGRIMESARRQQRSKED